MGKYTEQAKELLEHVGGSGNISVVTHCATRMRFVLNDPSKADIDSIEKMKLVKGTFTQAGQFQVIIGNEVSSFYNEFIGNRYTELNDYKGLLLEGLMYDVVKPMIHRSDVICRFKKEPHFGGLEGSNVAALSFSKNQDSLKGKLKRFLGNVIRLFFPRFWF